MFRKFCLVSLFFLLAAHAVSAQEEILKEKIARIVAPMKAEVGVSVLGIEDGKALSVNGENKFPMQSVFKFPIALAVLSEVDKGRFALDQEMDIGKSDLLPNTWSPIREKYPDGNIKMSLAEVLKYTVSQSDNNGCDILLGLIGGPEVVNDYIHGLGIKDFSVQFNEQEMHQDWNIQFSNWATPVAVTELLRIFYERKNMSLKSFDFLWGVMMETKTGPNRIKGQLPPGTPVAHKTGTSDTNKEGVTAAVNDVGIITLPDGKHVAIAVFVANSREDSATNEKIIADISRAVWDDFEGQGGRQ
nr:beta-lactamase [uncultured bacterium]